MPKKAHEKDVELEKSPCRSHPGALITSLFVYLGIVLLVVVGVWQTIILSVLAYLISFAEAHFSKTRSQLANQHDTEQADKVIESYKYERHPFISFHIECYHYETKRERYTDSQGRSRTRTRKEKVVTFRGSEICHYDYWCDDTGNIVGLENLRMARLEIQQLVTFDDSYTAEQVQRRYTTFVDKHKNKDKHYSASQDIGIRDVPSGILVRWEETSVSCWISLNAFWIFHILTCSWLYRLWFDGKTAGRTLPLKKKILILNPQTPTNLPEWYFKYGEEGQLQDVMSQGDIDKQERENDARNAMMMHTQQQQGPNMMNQQMPPQEFGGYNPSQPGGPNSQQRVYPADHFQYQQYPQQQQFQNQQFQNQQFQQPNYQQNPQYQQQYQPYPQQQPQGQAITINVPGQGEDQNNPSNQVSQNQEP